MNVPHDPFGKEVLARFTVMGQSVYSNPNIQNRPTLTECSSGVKKIRLNRPPLSQD